MSDRLRKTMQRKPSHFGSYCHSSPTGISSTKRASIGGSGGFMGKDMSPDQLERRAPASLLNPPVRLGPASQSFALQRCFLSDNGVASALADVYLSRLCLPRKCIEAPPYHAQTATEARPGSCRPGQQNRRGTVNARQNLQPAHQYT